MAACETGARKRGNGRPRSSNVCIVKTFASFLLLSNTELPPVYADADALGNQTARGPGEAQDFDLVIKVLPLPPAFFAGELHATT